MVMIAGGNHTLIYGFDCGSKSTQRLSGCGARKTIRIAKDALVFRPLPRAHLALSAAGSARIAFPEPTSLGTFLLGGKKVPRRRLLR